MGIDLSFFTTTVGGTKPVSKVAERQIVNLTGEILLDATQNPGTYPVPKGLTLRLRARHILEVDREANGGSVERG